MKLSTLVDLIQKIIKSENTPSIPVNFDTNQHWWNDLDTDWKAIFKHHIKLEGKPTLEDIKKMQMLEIINAEHFDLTNCYPLFALPNLKKLSLRNTSVTNINSLKNLKNLKYLDLTFSHVGSLKPIWNLDLKILKCKRCSKLQPTEIQNYIKTHPNCKVDWDYNEDRHWLDAVNGIM